MGSRFSSRRFVSACVVINLSPEINLACGAVKQSVGYVGVAESKEARGRRSPLLNVSTSLLCL